MNSQEIKEFYSRLHFPGRYTIEDLKFYEEQGIHNIYLREINNYLNDDIEVLDVGCGTGLVSNLFAMKYNSNFTSIDFSDSVDYAKDFAYKNEIKNVTWIKDDFLNFSTDKKFDVIICCGVLHHIPEHEQALVKMKSMLKEDGILILAVYNRYGKILKRYFKIKYYNEVLYQDQENNPFELSFTHKEVVSMCRDLKFEAVTPGLANSLVDFRALFNSINGGLALYVFRN
jgi:2-polyprenyl-3-methyl-5-hydroxy-6-metoxy-1,4-benzoquinol methylase